MIPDVLAASPSPPMPNGSWEVREAPQPLTSLPKSIRRQVPFLPAAPGMVISAAASLLLTWVDGKRRTPQTALNSLAEMGGLTSGQHGEGRGPPGHNKGRPR